MHSFIKETIIIIIHHWCFCLSFTAEVDANAMLFLILLSDTLYCSFDLLFMAEATILWLLEV